MNKIEDFYLTKPEPVKSCLLTLRDIIIKSNSELVETWKYGMPFFYFRKKMFCYLWVRRKDEMPYIGIVEGRKIHHPGLVQEKRSRMKVFFIEPTKDLPVRTIQNILKKATRLYQSQTRSSVITGIKKKHKSLKE